MIPQQIWCLILALACQWALVPASVWAAAAPPAGLVVEEVRPGTAGHQAGLLPGDILVAWRRGPVALAGLPESGELAQPFDLAEVFLEQMPRAEVTLLGRRGEEPFSWVLRQGTASAWPGIRAVPLLSGGILEQYRRAAGELKAAGGEASTAALRAAAAEVRSQGAEELAAWFLAEGARQLAEEKRWEEADTLYQEALAHGAARQPAVAAQLYREWGNLFHQRFTWDRALERYERALEADRRKPFPSLAEAGSLAGLALLDLRSGGSRDEEELYRQSIEIRQRLAPGSEEAALGWLQWGHGLAMAGEWQAAVERYRHAFRLLPESGVSPLLLAEGLVSLAFVLEQLGENEEAREAWHRAHSLLMKEAPEDILAASATQGLGMVAVRQGDLARGEELLIRAGELFRRHRPDGVDEADNLRELGRVQRLARKREAGSRTLCKAMDMVEALRQRLRAQQNVRHWWGRFSADYHRECAESLAEIGRVEDAFRVVELGRARAFLDLRAERGLRLSALSSERRREWQRLNAEYEGAQRDLARVEAREETTLEQIVNLEGRLREIRRKKERLLERDLPAGSVRYPEPLALAEARRRLEPGTVLLLYSMGRTKTLLFVLSPDDGGAGGTVLTLNVSGDQLRERVNRFRRTMVEERFDRRALAAQSKALYDLLLAPAEPHLVKAERLVVAPDGPLHTLPFAALRRGDQYLIEWKPLHFTLSATAYADQLAQRRPPGAGKPAKLVAFGDPGYLPVPPGAAPTRGLLGQGVPRLPASREEVERIAELYPGARVVLGDQVTEEAVKEAAGGASLLHFAVHGLLTERTPLNSALVLSPSRASGEEGRNGLLQVWEVMEGLQLDADLVTLSACETALGREVGGEGLVGLTRAFQYAGARSVIATLWEISDRSTAGFMTRLYGALKDGKTKDEALRAAQIAQIHSDKPQPFYWAAFQLFGDWR